KSKSGRLATTISRPSFGSQERHGRVSRSRSCFAKRRKVQKPAKLCATGEAKGSNLSLYRVVNVNGTASRSTSGLFIGPNQPPTQSADYSPPPAARHSVTALPQSVAPLTAGWSLARWHFSPGSGSPGTG